MLENNINKLYKKRINPSFQYPYTRPDIFLNYQEREMYFLNFLSRYPIEEFESLKLLDIGYGRGFFLLDLLKYGFLPSNLYGTEILSGRYENSSKYLPSNLNLYNIDILDSKFPLENFDIIHQSLVFSSISNSNHRILIANMIKQLLKENGCFIWYDFIYNNPFNKDVCGIKVSSIRQLFPEFKIKVIKCTLCPPIAKRICSVSSLLYNLLKSFKVLNTHVFCILTK